MILAHVSRWLLAVPQLALRRPPEVLDQNCFECHDAEMKKGGLIHRAEI
jgi:hypothetical protein